MNDVTIDFKDSGLSRDFATTSAERSRVFLEAREWDQRLKAYRVVTLHLSPEEADLLAGKLLKSAVAARDQMHSSE
jgi:hypothetical protein